jgi:uncharacterized protein (TIGR02246 family)
MRTLIIILSVAILTVACAPQADPPADHARPVGVGAEGMTTEASQQQIDQLRQRWVEAAQRGDAAAVAALYADDAVVTSAQEQARGRQQIEQLWQRQLPMTSNLQINSTRSEAGRDLASDYGTFSQQITPPDGAPMQVSGEYLVVTRREDDGSWRVVKHMSWMQPPAGETPAATATR